MSSLFKTEQKENFNAQFKYHPSITVIIVTAFLITWSTLYLQTNIDVDTAWLLECLDRFMAGGNYLEDFYETNPPLSFWLYLPAYPLYNFLDIDPRLAVFINVIFYIGTADYLLLRLIQKEENIKAPDILVIMSAILIAQSWIAGEAFLLKDHIITVFLLPFCLYQYRITRALKTDIHLSIISILAGGIAICLKPHYAIIPALLFAHRLYKTRSIIKCIGAPDFWGMLIIGISYFAAIYIFTPEFFELLPQIISLYSIDKPFPILSRYPYLAFPIFAIISTPILFTDKSQTFLKQSTYILATLSIICIIPYTIQNKGFHYQALPTLYYGEAALLIALYGFSKQLLHAKTDIALLCAITFVILFFGTLFNNLKNFELTKDRFLAQPMITAIDDLAWNRVYANYYYKHLTVQLPHISSLKRGSRFGEIWPLTGLTTLIKNTENDAKRTQIKQQMYEIISMIAQDMKRYKPSVITIPQYTDPKTDKPSKNYYNFLMQHKEFKHNMTNYKYHSTVLFSIDASIEVTSENHKKFANKIVPHDIYVLKRKNTL